MVGHPKVLSATASVDEVRAVLAEDHVHMVLLTEREVLVGTVVSDDLPPAETATGQALAWSRLAGRTVEPLANAQGVRQQLVAKGLRRLAVVDDDGRLLGLLCLKRSLTGFCSDADVAARGCSGASSPG